ncbi:MAG: CapA family protein [Bacteroidales bacterium]|nr:CapA family protein [Bacteroidales bacterium]
MRRFLTFAFFFASSVLAGAQIVETVPPARPLRYLPDTSTVLIMGDVMMHRDQISNSLTPDGGHEFPTYFTHISGMMMDADLTIANMEFTLAGKPYSGYPCFSAPDGYEDYVASCGVDVFLTANNHILDKGKEGIERTLGRYSQMEEEGLVRHTGCSDSPEDDSRRFPLMVAVRGTRVALVNFTYGTNLKISSEFPKVHLPDKEEIASAIKKARKAGAEFVIALPHWGTEYALRHSASQEKLADWLVEQGCDAVVGAHPHVVQDFERIAAIVDGRPKSAPVLYSLGNIISNMSATNTQVGLITILRIVTDENGDKRLLKPQFVYTWCTRPGTLTDSYSTIPVRAFIGKRHLWKNPSDYDNMIRSYERVKATTGLND